MTRKQIHLLDYLKIVRKHLVMILVVLVVVFAVALLVTQSRTRMYKGSTKVMIEKETSSNLMDDYSRYDPSFYTTQYELIKSQKVARRVVELLDLETTYDSYFAADKSGGALQTTKSWVKQLLGKYILPEQEASEQEESAQESTAKLSRGDRIAESLRGGLKVTNGTYNSLIVTIEYKSSNPEFAALIANTVAGAYIDTTLEMKMETTRRTLDWMSEKAEQERNKLEATELRLQDYVRKNDLVTLEDRLTVIPETLAAISTQLVSAQSNREMLEARYHKVRDLADRPDAVESILSVTNGSTLQILRDQILKAEQNIRELSDKYGAKHPSMIKVKGDLEILQQKKLQEVQRLIDSTRSEYELAVSDERNLRRQFERTKAEAQTLNEKFVQYQSFSREKKANQYVYDSLLLKMTEQDITGENQPVNMWIVENAMVPRSPYSPNTMKNLLAGLAAGLFCGIGLAFFIEYMDQGIKNPEEAESALGLPVLGLVPMFKDKEGSVELVMTDQPRSAMAESYRALRTSLLLSSADHPPRSILITSPEPGAGKSTTSVNLAIAMAQSGKKVLLIDADMRKPRLHKVLGLKANVGLSGYLAGMTNSDFLQHTAHDKLSFLSAGPIPPNPSELLLSARMERLVDKLLETFDCIICDSPPLQSVVDARIFSRLFDGTVLVVKGRTTTFDTARRSLKQLHDSNSSVFGILINALELKKSDDYYYEAYYAAYGDEPQELKS
jgi:capsular exopolysaccharide synthesis family protein